MTNQRKRFVDNNLSNLFELIEFRRIELFTRIKLSPFTRNRIGVFYVTIVVYYVFKRHKHSSKHYERI